MNDTDRARYAALIAAEERAFAMLAGIEAAGIIAPGRSESEVTRDIEAIAERDFGVEKHWHKRLVRTGANTLRTYSEYPDELVIAENNTVFVDLGPVFEEWEADIGQTYALGPDPARRALVAALPEVFEEIRAKAHAEPDITGAELYAFACARAEARGYGFGGKISGHIVGEYSHATWEGVKAHRNIGPENPTPLSDLDAQGRTRFWIIEVHLVAPDRSFGGFYERLLRR